MLVEMSKGNDVVGVESVHTHGAEECLTLVDGRKVWKMRSNQSVHLFNAPPTSGSAYKVGRVLRQSLSKTGPSPFDVLKTLKLEG